VNVDGFLKQAMIHGGILLIDEVTATPAHVLMCLQAVLERTPGQPPRLVDSRTSEIVEAHPRFRVIVSDNTNGQGDVTRSYQGTNVMNEAFRNRFGLWMDKTYPEPSAWSEILQTKTKVLPAVADQIVKIAGIVNSGSAMLGAPGGTVTCNSVVSPRDTLNVARLAVILGQLKAAFQMGLIKAMHKENPDRQFIEDTIRNVLGGAA
jgi:MoxR-like ATPase